jgi:hypothetical protein
MHGFDWAGLAGLLGMGSIVFVLLLLGRLSQRLGQVTNAAPYYTGFYLGAVLVTVGGAARAWNLSDASRAADLHQTTLWVLLYNGAPALGVTLGVIFAWRYWSWLLAERD